MTRRGRWLYFVGVIALTVGVVFALAPYTNWLPRGPAAQPGPAAAEQTQEAAVPASPKATVEFGASRLEPTVIDGVPTVDLVLKKVQWDTGGGTWKEAYSINGMVPGPELRLKEGQFTRFRVKNELDEPTSIHWHGIILPGTQDGVAHLTQDPIEPGETFVYEFKPGPPGTHMYHSHF
ncbi:MAG TPA: multicopper oxidase domain-containing protein, partial [Symbiobacteriaceae bacterium]|nr:multicopper oxidase domain-containing protein [Symbiobacteriaceae bacterium]